MNPLNQTEEKREAVPNGVSRVGIAALGVLLQVLWIVWAALKLTRYYAWVQLAISVLAFLLALRIYGRHTNSATKLSWIIVILTFPIFGVCLGHQAICKAFGATVSYASQLMHGKQSMVTLDTDCPIFKGMKKTIPAARYHSLAAVRETMPEELKITAETEDGEIMGVMHRDYPIYGVQFHPESILTPDGYEILKNFCGGLKK